MLMFLKDRHAFLSEGLTFFPTMGSMRSETKYIFFKIAREDTHTDSMHFFGNLTGIAKISGNTHTH